MDNKRRWWWTPSRLRPVLSFILVIAPALSSGWGSSGTPLVPTKAFSITPREHLFPPKNLLCSSLHLQLSHWSLNLFTHTQKHTLKVDKVTCKRLSSSLVFTGVLSPLPRLALQSRWLSLVDSGKPLLILVASCLRWITGCHLERDNYLPFIHYNDLNYSSGIIYLV